MNTHRFCLLALCAFLAAVLSSADAQTHVSEPSVNLGDTSFLDGIAGPGGVVEEIVDTAHDGTIVGGDGKRVEGTGSVNGISGLTHMAWLSHRKMPGAWYNAEMVGVAAYVNAGTQGKSGFRRSHRRPVDQFGACWRPASRRPMQCAYSINSVAKSPAPPDTHILKMRDSTIAKGRASVQAGGMKFTAEAGSFISVPRHTEHSFVLDEESTLINFYFPTGFELWLMGSAVSAQRHELPPKDLPPPVYEQTKRRLDAYGGLPRTKERSASANPAAPAVPSVTRRETAENYWYERGCWSILADGGSTSGSYSVSEVELRVGTLSQMHIYDFSDESFYVLDDAMRFVVDDQIFHATAHRSCLSPVVLYAASKS